MSNYTPPMHPQPGIFETTIAPGQTQEGQPGVITPDGYEQIVTRPAWDFTEAEQRLFADQIKPGNGRHVVGRTPKQRPARRTTKKRGG